MSKSYRVSAGIKLVEDATHFGALATVDGDTEMRIGDSRAKAAVKLLYEFPELLEWAEEEPDAPVVVKPVVTEEEAARIASLTEREREVLSILAEGCRNQQIAERLQISIITVRHHLTSVFSKLKVDDRFEAAIFAYRTGLVAPAWLNARAYQRMMRS